MRIQHNIAAMNAYRNYSNNTSAVSKNLEKLSSGYKINRAGDDAAGLAISEKMRAQITGLETAQKNAKDGISLVKTAEGALQEVHDMLNRMVTLATQSANGTYDNETDRAQLQKEVDQLKTEIDRIADSANFNGISLLDGSMDADGLRETTETVFAGLKASTNVNGTAETTGVNKDFGGPNANGGLMLTGSDLASPTTGNASPTDSDKSVRYHQDAAAAGKTSFDIELGNVEFNIGSGTSIDGLIFGLDSGTAPGTKGAGGGNNGVFTGATGSTQLTYSVTAGSEGKITGEDIASAIMDAIGSDGKIYIEPAGGGKRIEYSVTQDGSKLSFVMTDDGYNTAAAADAAKTGNENYFQGNFNFALNYKTTAPTDPDELAFTNAVGAIQNCSTCNINEGTTPNGTIYAEALIRFDATANTTTGINKITDVIADGKGLQIGDEYYLFAASDEIYNGKYADNVHVVDIRDLGDIDDTTNFADDLRVALDRLSVAAKDNEMFDVQVTKGGNALVLTERSTYTGDANLTMKDYGLENQIRTFSSATSSTTVNKEAGKSLTLQIGDTSDDYNQMKVNIKDCHTDSLGLADMDISTQEGAAAAIDKIKSAINYVSDVRGTLGATQNRLEHTINNLSVMTENIQDAESTIRDTDVAEEMMAYTKNNILVQSAQAMLAQANQIPQGVLQLLG